MHPLWVHFCVVYKQGESRIIPSLITPRKTPQTFFLAGIGVDVKAAWAAIIFPSADWGSAEKTGS
jgi:hypothetical protein